VFVAGAGVACAAGFDWRGLAGSPALPTGARARVPPVPSACDPCDPRRLNLMSRAAYLGAVALHAARNDAGFGEETGLYMGVGASGGELSELQAMLQPSLSPAGRFDPGRFGSRGLAAANPLFAFQLMNNFTLCHGAILARLSGPSTALYSRGAGTVTALREAAFAVAEREVDRACAGGADSALHPVTLAELERDGALTEHLVPGEGAALLGLTADGPGLARLVRAEVIPVHRPSDDRALETAAVTALAGISTLATLVLAPWGRPARAALEAASQHWTGPRLDLASVTGETLAAGPALGWALALDRLVGGDRQAVVLSAGLDGDLGLVELRREDAA
jgi:3-oxoacyl-(acyl-carrier-protein) synthase